MFLKQSKTAEYSQYIKKALAEQKKKKKSYKADNEAEEKVFQMLCYHLGDDYQVYITEKFGMLDRAGVDIICRNTKNDEDVCIQVKSSEAGVTKFIGHTNWHDLEIYILTPTLKEIRDFLKQIDRDLKVPESFRRLKESKIRQLNLNLIKDKSFVDEIVQSGFGKILEGKFLVLKS